MFNTINQAIVGLLETLTDLKKVYDFPETSGNDGYPFAYSIYTGDDSETTTNAQDRVRAEYKIFLCQEKFENSKGRRNAEITSNDRTYKIEKLFRDKNDLGMANILRVLPVSAKKTYIDGGTRIQIEITLQVEFLQNVKI
jgi:hypothetical protein